MHFSIQQKICVSLYFAMDRNIILEMHYKRGRPPPRQLITPYDADGS